MDPKHSLQAQYLKMISVNILTYGAFSWDHLYCNTILVRLHGRIKLYSCSTLNSSLDFLRYSFKLHYNFVGAVFMCKTTWDSHHMWSPART